MATFRYNIRPFDCVSDVVCGDDIEANWGNQMRNLGEASFQRGDTSLTRTAEYIGIRQKPIVGFCNNYIRSYDNDPERLIRFAYDVDVRFQPAIPYYHDCSELYVGNANDGTTYGAPVNDNGIEGHKFRVGSIENAGYNRAAVMSMVRRGKRNVTPANITANNTDTHIFELREDDNYPMGYEQHIQCWYCRENPSGPSFPPLKWLLFDDTDCPLRSYKEINKIVPITPPAVNQSEIDYILISVWYSVPFIVLFPGTPGQPGFNVPNGLFVNNTAFHDWDLHPDGVLDLSIKLFKECT